MYLNLHSLRQAEERTKIRLANAMNTTLVVSVMTFLVILLALLLAQQQ